MFMLSFCFLFYNLFFISFIKTLIIKDYVLTQIVLYNDITACVSNSSGSTCMWTSSLKDHRFIDFYMHENNECILQSGNYLNYIEKNYNKTEVSVICQMNTNQKHEFIMVDFNLKKVDKFNNNFLHCSTKRVEYQYPSFLEAYVNNNFFICKPNDKHIQIVNKTVKVLNSTFLILSITEELSFVLACPHKISKYSKIVVNGINITNSYIFQRMSKTWFYIDSKKLFNFLKTKISLVSFDLIKPNNDIDTFLLILVDHKTINENETSYLLINNSVTKIYFGQNYNLKDNNISILFKCNFNSCNADILSENHAISYNNSVSSRPPQFTIDEQLDSVQLNGVQSTNSLYDVFAIFGGLICLLLLCCALFNLIKYCIRRKAKHNSSFQWIKNTNYKHVYNIHDSCELQPQYTCQLHTSTTGNPPQQQTEEMFLSTFDTAITNISDTTNSTHISNQYRTITMSSLYSSVISTKSPTDKSANRKSFQFSSITEQNLKIKQCIGKGAFGKVFLADLFYIDNADFQQCKEVAAKELITLSNDDGTTNNDSLMKEINIMMKIGQHPNIVSSLGIISRKYQNHLLIMEYCRHGNLKDYVNRLKQNPVSDPPLQIFLRFCLEIASGMDYLSSKNIIHRDLASRNVLISDYITCKISDFGLSRQLPTKQSYYINLQGAIPLKWMAPEVIYQSKYSTMADVWSYGVLLWEIYSLGEVPYNNFTAAQMKDLISNGYRMSIPKICPNNVVEIINQCWNFESRLRPLFSEIVNKLK